MSNMSTAGQLPAWLDAQIFGRAANYWTANQTLSQAAAQFAVVDSKNGAFTLRSPIDANVGDVICIVDPGGWCATNSVTFNGSGYQVQSPSGGGLNATYVMTTNFSGYAWMLVQDPLASQGPTDVNGRFWALIWASPLVAGGGGSSFYQTVQDTGTAKAQRPILDFIGFTVADDAPGTRTVITAPNGAIYSPTVTANTTLVRATWRVQPVGTAAGPVTIIAPAGALEGDIVELPDSDGTYGVNAMTFAGNGRNVINPYVNPPASAATFVTPAGLYCNPAWMLIKTSAGATPASTLIWRAVRST